MSTGLVGLHVLIIVVAAALLVLLWAVNPSFYNDPIHTWEYGLIAVPFVFTTVSLFLNLGWLIPLAMIGYGIMSFFPSAWSGTYEGYMYTRMTYMVVGFFCGATLGASIDARISDNSG